MKEKVEKVVKYMEGLLALDPPESVEPTHFRMLDWLMNELMDLLPDLDAEGGYDDILKAAKEKVGL